MDILRELMNGNLTENNTIMKYLSLILLTIIILLVCLVAHYVTKEIVKRIIHKYIKKSKSQFDDILYDNGFYEKLAHLVPIIIIYIAEPLFNEYAHIVRKIAGTYLIIALVLALVSLLDSVDALYKQFEISKTRPITAVLQVAKIIVYIIAGILFVATIMGENPLTLLGGIGALSAVFSLIFKDPIMGFVGGVQLTSTDMLRVGDWIYVPKYDAEGTVTEIALTTISMQAFDKTTITVPNYSLITDSFTNYRGMQDAGGRRIKKTFYVDIKSIKLLTKEEIEQFKQIAYINEYIFKREEQVPASNTDLKFNDESINDTGITNMEILRASAQNYIDNHPKLRKDMALRVRQFTPEGNGMPIEVYCFSDTTVWVEYEDIQAEVFDHVYTIAAKLDLKLFQKPSGYDIQKIIDNNKG